MKVLDRIFDFFRNLFYKKEEVKMLEAPKINNNKMDFINAIKVVANKNINNEYDEVLVCVGDGLGFKKNISY